MKKLNKVFLSLALVLVLAMPIFAGCSLSDDNKTQIYTINAISNNNTFGEVLGSGTYTKDEVVLIYAKSKDGYAFEKWNDNNTENPRQVTVDSNKNFVANFREESNTKYAVIESVKMVLYRDWGSYDKISCYDWYVTINGCIYGNAGGDTVLGDGLAWNALAGCRRSFASSNGVYYINNKLEIGQDYHSSIHFNISELNLDGIVVGNNVELSLYSSSSIVFNENDNELSVIYSYPNYGKIKLTFIYFVL